MAMLFSSRTPPAPPPPGASPSRDAWARAPRHPKAPPPVPPVRDGAARLSFSQGNSPWLVTRRQVHAGEVHRIRAMALSFLRLGTRAIDGGDDFIPVSLLASWLPASFVIPGIDRRIGRFKFIIEMARRRIGAFELYGSGASTCIRASGAGCPNARFPAQLPQLIKPFTSLSASPSSARRGTVSACSQKDGMPKSTQKNAITSPSAAGQPSLPRSTLSTSGLTPQPGLVWSGQPSRAVSSSPGAGMAASPAPGQGPPIPQLDAPTRKPVATASRAAAEAATRASRRRAPSTQLVTR